MKRALGLVLVVVGVGVSATFGSVLSPPERAIAVAEGHQALAGGPAPAAVTAGPGERLSAWAGASGLPFLGGLVLVVAGAVLSRVAAKEALSEEPEAGEAGPVDFAALLDELVADVAALGAAMDDPPEDAAGFATTQARLEDIQREKVDRLVAAGPRVQLRIGLDGFAAVFSPLSAGERKLNRAWSALVDHHWPEASASVAAASAALVEARAELARRTPAA